MSNCKNCAETHETVVPEAVYEKQARAERHSKRWMIAFFVAIAMLFATNICWLICKVI